MSTEVQFLIKYCIDMIIVHESLKLIFIQSLKIGAHEY